MEGIIFVCVAIAVVFNLLVKAGLKAQKSDDAPRRTSPPRTVPIGQVSAQKRAQARRDPQWREAKRKQDDAEQLHSIHMDSCESRLQSLKVLHEAGILDNEEYAQRVARVRAQHAAGGRR